jgi:hypothetical protein
MMNNKNFEKMSQDVSNIGKEAMEACQKSAAIMAKSGQDCMSVYMNMMQASAEKQSKMMQEMLSKKTVTEIGEAMQSASQESFSDMMVNLAKLSEQSMKTAMEIMEPINNQMNKAMKKASQNIAA